MLQYVWSRIPNSVYRSCWDPDDRPSSHRNFLFSEDHHTLSTYEIEDLLRFLVHMCPNLSAGKVRAVIATVQATRPDCLALEEIP
jgi:hypothetical protein